MFEEEPSPMHPEDETESKIKQIIIIIDLLRNFFMGIVLNYIVETI